MSATDELRTNRIDGTIDDGNDLATKFSNFEAAMRNILGIPADTAMSEAMQIASDGDVVMTGKLTLAGTPTTDLMASTKSYFQSQSSGMGKVRARAYLTVNKTISDDVYVDFGASDINVGGVWSISNPSRLTIPEDGDGSYLVGASTSFNSASGETAADVEIIVNRGFARTILIENQSLEIEIGASGCYVIPDLSAGDYIELHINPTTDPDLTIYAANTTFWLFNLD